MSWLLVCVLLSATFSFAQFNAAPQTAKPNPNWRAAHNSAIIIDTHADTPGRFVDENFDLSQDAGSGYMDFKEIKAGNLGAEFFSIWVEPKGNKGHEAKRALDMIDSVYMQAERHPDKMMMAFSTDDIRRAHREKKFAALLGVEGGHAIEGDIRILRDYYRLGVRYMTLTWSNTNDIGDSSGDISDTKIQHHGGLTPFGRASGHRDEPHGHDGRHLARCRLDLLPGDRAEPGAGDRFALVVPRADQRSPQHDRRHAAHPGEA